MLVEEETPTHMSKVLPRLPPQALDDLDDQRVRSSVLQSSADASERDEERFLDRG